MMAMEKLKKRFNTSPIIKKKGTPLNGSPSTGTVRGDGSTGVGQQKTFGASLEELALRERCDVPLIVRKICDYVLERGLSVEGLFRINGNVRLIQSLMATYEAEGDVDLSECNDIHSVAGLLKRFVRVLSDGLIPEQLTADFIKAVDRTGESEDACLSEIRKLLECLSQESYATLRYLCYFLWEVCQKEAENKMSAGSLGIVFGPNVFRCKENGIDFGLPMSYTHCNRAMSIMISNCHCIFEKPEAGCLLPCRPGASAQSGRKATPPPRPPPPILPSPGESPRLLLQAAWGRTQSDEPARSSSPFLQDNSETECSLSRDIVTGPPAPTVSNVIHYVISDSIFGEDENESLSTPSPKPRKTRARSRSSPAPDPNCPNDSNYELQTSNTAYSNTLVSSTVASYLQLSNTPASDTAASTSAATSSRVETFYPDSGTVTLVPSVTPRRSRRSDAPNSSSRYSVNPEINNNLQGSHSLPELKVTDNHSPSDADQSIGEVTARITGESDEDRSTVIVQDLRRQIQALKRHVRRFEEQYAKVNGHKPSVSEKNSDKEVKSYLSDLALCRRRLRALQDGSDDSEAMLKSSARSRSAEHIYMNGTIQAISPRAKSRTTKPRLHIKIDHRKDETDTVAHDSLQSQPKSELEMALDELEHEMQVKRELSGRPEELLAMTWDQIREEKIALQRGLLNHESRYGRPRTMDEKEVMRPVYDRYRTVKRVLSEGRRGEAPDSMVQSAVVGTTSTLSMDDGTSTGGGDLFAVTQDFQSRMRREGLMTASLVGNPAGATPAVIVRRSNVRTAGARNRDKRRSQPIMPSGSQHINSSIEHLREEENRLRCEKKQLQRVLKQYERKFEQETGRRLEKEDRKPMHNEYIRYKKIKIRLKDLNNAISMNP